MFNPFCILTPELLEAFIQNGKKYFVRQQYGYSGKADEGMERHFIFTHYPNIASAMDHFGTIENDLFRYVYDWNNEAHRKRLVIAAGKPEGFKIWAGVFQKNWERLITRELEEKIRKYIKSMGWQPSRNDIINPKYYLYYGHLYVELKFKKKIVRIKFEEIENIA